MRTESVSARGLKGLFLFTQGLFFSLRDIPAGVVAIIGANGQGKTTFLELILAVLFGEWPSRPGCSLIDSVDTRDGFIEAEIAMDGRGLYRARVNIDSVKRTTDAVLELIRPDGQRQVLNDGKVSTFREAVAREFPPLTLVLASAFAAQNKAGSFATLGKKERKELFAQLLGLEHFEQMASTARTLALSTDRRLGELRELVKHLLPLTDSRIEDEISETGNRLQAELGGLELDRAEQRHAVAAAEQLATDLQKQSARFIAATAEHDALVRRRADRLADVEQMRRDVTRVAEDEALAAKRSADRRDDAIRRAEADIASLATPDEQDVTLQGKLDAIAATLAPKLKQRRDRIARNRTELLDRETDIRDAARKLAECDSALRALDLQIAVSDKDLRLARELRRERESLVREAEDAVRALDRDRKAAELLERVPFGEKCVESGCEFVQTAAEAKRRLAEADARQATLTDARAALDAAVSALETHERNRAAILAQIDQQRATAGQYRTTAELLPHLEAASEKVKGYEADIATLEAEAEQERERARQWRREAEQGVAELRAKLTADIARFREACDRECREAAAGAEASRQDLTKRIAERQAELEGSDRQIAALARVRDENAAAHQRLIEANETLAAARNRLSDTELKLARIGSDISNFERRRAEYKARLAERERLERVVGTLETDLIEWSNLAKVFGRDGLPVLEIDSAGPNVSALANDLLRACFGSRFTVELVTQEPKADGKGFKEVFDLRVYDAERSGEPKDLGLMSGGEQVIVEEAVKSAIALHINQQNVVPIRTCWRDETIGSLDPDKALKYVAMLRRIRERGNFEHVLFIAHNLEAAALADAQIVLANGTIEVRYPPFADAGAAA